MTFSLLIYRALFQTDFVILFWYFWGSSWHPVCSWPPGHSTLPVFLLPLELIPPFISTSFSTDLLKVHLPQNANPGLFSFFHILSGLSHPQLHNSLQLAQFSLKQEDPYMCIITFWMSCIQFNLNMFKAELITPNLEPVPNSISVNDNHHWTSWLCQKLDHYFTPSFSLTTYIQPITWNLESSEYFHYFPCIV